MCASALGPGDEAIGRHGRGECLRLSLPLRLSVSLSRAHSLCSIGETDLPLPEIDRVQPEAAVGRALMRGGVEVADV